MSPGVSVIVPCFNEARTIRGLLQAISDQTHPVGDLEVIIADGMSTDGTRPAVEAFARERPDLRVRLIDNPGRAIPAALNRAIAQASGEVIIRLDAHSIPAPDYIERCLRALEATGAANAGGVWDIRPSAPGWVAQAIAVAAAHPLGAGDARYRIRGAAGEVDTVPFGAYRRSWLERVGPFDESLLTNEDYELNLRLRQAGGTVYFDPAIRSIYFARPTLPALARQYARYGYWKARMARRYPASLRWRQLLPPAFVLAAVVLALLATAWPPARILAGVQWALYGAIILAAGLVEAARRRELGLLIGIPLALATMHLAWGGAFLWGLLAADSRGRRDA